MLGPCFRKTLFQLPDDQRSPFFSCLTRSSFHKVLRCGWTKFYGTLKRTPYEIFGSETKKIEKKMISPLYISKNFENANSLSLRDILTAGTRFFLKTSKPNFSRYPLHIWPIPKKPIYIFYFLHRMLYQKSTYFRKNFEVGSNFFPRYFPYKI